MRVFVGLNTRSTWRFNARSIPIRACIKGPRSAHRAQPEKRYSQALMAVPSIGSPSLHSSDAQTHDVNPLACSPTSSPGSSMVVPTETSSSTAVGLPKARPSSCGLRMTFTLKQRMLHPQSGLSSKRLSGLAYAPIIAFAMRSGLCHLSTYLRASCPRASHSIVDQVLQQCSRQHSRDQV